jgi:protein-L-isoaspartate O-methyltransferase
MNIKKIFKSTARRFTRPKNNRIRNWKPSWVPRGSILHNEINVHPHIPEERADLFLNFNTGSSEIEVLNWLYSTICLLKPENVLETGAAYGLGTIALASACKANGFGTVHSVEIDPAFCQTVEKKVRKLGLQAFTKIICEDSLNFLAKTSIVFDLGYFDSLCEIRGKEFEIVLDRGIIKQLAVFHDTSPYRCLSLPDLPDQSIHEKYRGDLYRLSASEKCSGIMESRLSRGIIAISIKS